MSRSTEIKFLVNWAVNEAAPVTQQDLRDLERRLQPIYNRYGLFFKFSTHFDDRMNHHRNRPRISLAEIERVFRRLAEVSYLTKISKIAPREEITITDTSSLINIGVVLDWERREEKTLFLAQTVMRKKDWTTRDIYKFTL